MEQGMMPDPGAAPAPTYTWSQVWVKALTQPSVATYVALVHDPAASTRRAYVWILIAGLVSFVLALFSQLAFTAVFGTEWPEQLLFAGENPIITLTGSAALALACGLPLTAVFSVLGLMIGAGIVQFVASLLGGTGNFRSLAYAFAAYLAPLGLVSSAISLVPVVSLCITVPLGIYGIVLNVIAVKAVNQFDWWKAAVSALFIPVLLLVLAVCLIVVLALLAVPIGDVFSGIQEGLQTP